MVVAAVSVRIVLFWADIMVNNNQSRVKVPVFPYCDLPSKVIYFW